MRKARKRKPDLRQIRTTKVYTLPEIAETLDRNIAAVRGWIRDGLPTLGDQKPVLVLGSALKAWLKAKRAARKHECEPDELLCFGCRRPRRPAPGSVRIEPRNAKTVSITGRCSVCGTRMNKAGSRARLAEIEETFRALSLRMKHLLSVCGDPFDKRTSQTQADEVSCRADVDGQLPRDLPQDGLARPQANSIRR